MRNISDIENQLENDPLEDVLDMLGASDGFEYDYDVERVARNKRLRGSLVDTESPSDDKKAKMQENVDELYIEQPRTFLQKVALTVKKFIHNPVLVAAAAIVLVILFVMRSYMVPSESMYPTLKIGDRIIGTAIYFPSCDSVERGDVVCFHPPGNNDSVYVKRVIAKEGDRVQISGNIIYVNGEVSPYGTSGGLISSLDTVIKEGHLWMAGDNGTVSEDSRFWGQLPAERLVCKVHAVYWPPNRVGFV